MYWIITKDHVASEDDTPRVGMGHYDSYWKGLVRKEEPGSPERMAKVKEFIKAWSKLKPPMDYEWRVLDDDGNVNYEGRCQDPGLWDEARAFHCLDWCMADVGATSFEYRKAQAGQDWRVL